MKSERFSWRARAKDKFKFIVWPVLHRLASPLVWVRRRLKPHKIFLSRVEGTVKGGDQPVTLLCGLSGIHKHFFNDLIFAEEEPRETPLGQFRLLDVFRSKRKIEKDVDIVVLETNPSLHNWLDDGGWFFIPNWIAGEVMLPLTEKCLRHDTLKTTFRKIRKHGYEYIVTREEERFVDFYNNMHRPYVTMVYGKKATADTFAEQRAANEVFDLILIRKSSEPDLFLGGFLIIYDPDAPRFWSLGVRDANREYVQEGVLAALYVFAFEHAQKAGYTRINMGACRPRLRDGVLRFKKKFGHRIATARWGGTSLKISALTPSTKAFLRDNPFVFREKDDLLGAAFTDTPLSVKVVEELEHELFNPGLTRLIIYPLNEGETFTNASLPPELAGHVEIRTAQEIISGKKSSNALS